MAGLRDSKYGPLAPGRTVWHCIAKAHRNLIDAKVAITLIEIRWMTKNISIAYMELFHNEAGVVVFWQLVSYRCAQSILHHSEVLLAWKVIRQPKLKSGLYLPLTAAILSMITSTDMCGVTRRWCH